jgi:hypothetical protein
VPACAHQIVNYLLAEPSVRLIAEQVVLFRGCLDAKPLEVR